MVSETNLSHCVCHRAKALSCCSSVNELYLKKKEKKKKFWLVVQYSFFFSITCGISPDGVYGQLFEGA